MLLRLRRHREALCSHEPDAAKPPGRYPGRWLNHIRPSLEASTFTIRKRIVNPRILDRFGERNLTQITWKEVRDWPSTAGTCSRWGSTDATGIGSPAAQPWDCEKQARATPKK